MILRRSKVFFIGNYVYYNGHCTLAIYGIKNILRINIRYTDICKYINK